MDKFELFELKTELDFENFCKILLETKGIAPVSLTCFVSLTIKRNVRVLEKEMDPEGELAEVARRIRGMLCQ